MKKLVCLIAFFVAVMRLDAQSYIPEQYVQDTSIKMSLRTNYQFNYHTSSIPNYYSNFFLRGGYIDKETKDKVSNGLATTNRAGAEQQFSIRFTDFSSHPFKKDTSWGYYLNLEHQDHIGLNFSKNVFDLVFYGNGPFAGDVMNLVPFNFSRMTFQKFGFGLTDAVSGTSIGISLVKGQRFSHLNFNQADFYTDDSTGNISFDYSLEYSQSDTAKTRYTAFNGAGLSVDLNWNFKICNDSILPFFSQWQLRVNNAGFIIWNMATLNYEADSIVAFNGFSVDNILKPQDALLTGSTDLKDTINIRYVNKKFNALLPADVVLGNTVNPFTGYWIKPLVGGRYKLMEGYKPMAYAGAVIRLAKRTYIQANVSYGGFGGFRTGLKFQTMFGKRLNFMVGSSHVDGLYSSRAFGKDGYLALWLNF